MIRVGQKLKEERLKQKLSIEEVSIATKIRISFLDHIEHGEYDKLPSSAYAAGFVRNYIEFLGLPTNEMMALFRRECETEKEIKVLPKALNEKRKLRRSKYRLQRTTFAIILLFVVLFGYLLYQYRFAWLAPTLEVQIPKEGAVITDNRVVVTGKTDPTSSVYVNDELTAVDQDGNFKKSIDLFPGSSKVVIKAINIFSKEAIVERTVEVRE